MWWAVGWKDLHSRCSTSRRSKGTFTRSFNCHIDPTHKQSAITQTTALDWSEGLDNEYHTAVGDVKKSTQAVYLHPLFSFRGLVLMHSHICSGGLHLRHIAKVLEMSQMSQRPHVPGEPLEGTDEAQGRCSCYTLTQFGGPGRNFSSRKWTKCLWLSREVQHSQLHKREKKTERRQETKRQGEYQEEKDRDPLGAVVSLSELSKSFPEMKHFIIIFVVKKVYQKEKSK